MGFIVFALVYSTSASVKLPFSKWRFPERTARRSGYFCADASPMPAINSNTNMIKYINSPIVFINNNNDINNCFIESLILCIHENSKLISSGVYFNIKNEIILSKNAKLQQTKGNNTILDTDKVYLNPKSSVDTSNMKYVHNGNNGPILIKANELQREREKFVKTLKLVENKYNVPIDKLEVRR